MTPPQISDEQLDRIQAYCDKATPGEWKVERRWNDGVEIVPRITCTPDDDRGCGWIADLIGAPYLGHESTLPNADFISNARTDLPLLITELRQARQENARLVAELDAHKGMTSRAIDRELKAQRELDAARKVVEAAKPFAELVNSTSGRIPTERLSLANWHQLTKAFNALPSPAASQGGEAKPATVAERALVGLGELSKALAYKPTPEEMETIRQSCAAAHEDAKKIIAKMDAEVERRVAERMKTPPLPAVGGRDTQAPAEAGEVERLREALEDSTNLLKSVPDEEGQIAAQIKDNEAALASDSGVKRD